MAVRDPDIVDGAAQYWFCDTQEEAEKIAAELRAERDSTYVIPPVAYSPRKKKFVVTCIKITSLK